MEIVPLIICNNRAEQCECEPFTKNGSQMKRQTILCGRFQKQQNLKGHVIIIRLKMKSVEQIFFAVSTYEQKEFI